MTISSSTEIADEILQSKKYSNIDRATVERICLETIPKYKKQKDIIKAVKRKLHIIHESFLQEGCHENAKIILNDYESDDINFDKPLALQLLALHNSTKERLAQIEEIYAFISQHVKCEDRIIDIGCGFNPLALPFLAQQPKSYFAYDINSSTAQTLNTYFNMAELPSYHAEICDMVTDIPKAQGDVLFAFKLFPLLQQQQKGRDFEVLTMLNCPTSIISFPTKSASGKEKGMEAFYSTQFEERLPSDFVVIEKVVFANEMFYVVGR